jgi:hypothetical protein
MGVIHQTEQRSGGGGLGEQSQHGQAHEETVRCIPGGHPEGHLQRACLGFRKGLKVAEQRSAELVQRRKRQLEL